MKNLGKLIEELCPNGVERKTLSEVGTFIRGAGIQKSELFEEGLPAIHYGEIHTKYGISADEVFSYIKSPKSGYRQVKTNDLIIVTTSEDVAGVGKPLAWMGEDSPYVSGETYIYRHDQNARYLAYLLQDSEFQNKKLTHITGTKVKRIHESAFSKIRFALPPVAIQDEIVLFLDKFRKLEKELKTELEARNTQYEYYRDFLIHDDSSSDGLTDLGQCLQKINRVNWKSNPELELEYIDLSSVDREIKAIVSTTRVNASTAPSRAQQLIKEGDVLFGSTRPTLNRLCLVPSEFDGQVASTGFCVLRSDPNKISPNYLFHLLNSTSFQSFVSENQEGASYPSISDGVIKSFTFKLPGLSEQARVATLLDKFLTLLIDVRTGLPAEITARREQFEHYRSKLLTFRELEVK